MRAHDKDGRRYLECLNYRGSYDELPYERMLAEIVQLYPHSRAQLDTMRERDSFAEAEAERC